MLATLFGIAMFHVVSIALPASYGTSLFDPVQDQIAPPAALGANGSVALAVATADGTKRLGILRPNGTTTDLPLPALADIKRQIAVESPPGFSTIVLASDGTPFVTVGSCFEAVGGGGCNTALFVWTGTWHALPHPQSTDQFTIPGARTLGTYALEDDFSNRSAVDSNNLPAAHAYLYSGSDHTDLGAYTILATRGTYAVGTESQPQNVMDPPSPAPTPAISHAVEFDGTRVTQLGIGVANAVNSSGDAVGDDESVSTGAGKPVVWTKGAAVVLSDASGTADAINDAGLIAGKANGHLFLTDEHDATHRVYALDDLLLDRTWHIEREFGIADTGRMLVIGRHAKGARQLMLLDPVRTRS